MKYKPVEGCYDGEYKQGEPLDLSGFPDEVRNQADDNWGEPVDFSVEEMLDMPVMGEVQNELTLTNTDCVDQNDLCKVVFTPVGVQSKTGDYKESDYIESNNFTPNELPQGKIPVAIDNNTHDNSNHELFCVAEKDLDHIDIDNLY